MKTVLVFRDTIDNTHSLGICCVYDEHKNLLFKSDSLELGWRDNQNNVSCIPAGNYPLKLEYSPKFNTDLWEIYGAGHRKECKFHSANYFFQLNGCIALGYGRADINNDGYMDITNSKNALKDFMKALEGEKEAKLMIINLDMILDK